jgi:hypothetical protein
MKIIVILICSITLLFACKKTDEFPSGTPNCVKNVFIENRNQNKDANTTIVKLTDGNSFFWKISVDNPNFHDVYFSYIFNEKCDTVCIPCRCVNSFCNINTNNLKEIK